MNHLTVKPSNAEQNNTEDNETRMSYNPDSMHELLGFVQSAVKSGEFSYQDIELTANMVYNQDR
ncbi:hypothetical protein M1M34_gp056 [Haloarcula tailed virus 2]|uniref:Uncharacterized protein n=1 Tax=Haloarcula tailed virus 2 TaxID=2877989 RepID=A0AAE8XZN0_9CAUD|nr:hypothetical protein M1M34_gp056 [Haloarcula tailed virus 2]UBF23277.1 hypothetical protein HATV-2_gp126 [Haloarcula tailed virus 2]